MQQPIDPYQDVRGTGPLTSFDHPPLTLCQCTCPHGTCSPERSRIGLLLTEEKEWLQICVSDQGEGIADEDLPLIWERFYRVDKSRNRSLGGSGLGLSISRGLIEAMGGTISVESKQGKGTVFKIRIPWQK